MGFTYARLALMRAIGAVGTEIHSPRRCLRNAMTKRASMRLDRLSLRLVLRRRIGERFRVVRGQFFSGNFREADSLAIAR